MNELHDIIVSIQCEELWECLCDFYDLSAIRLFRITNIKEKTKNLLTHCDCDASMVEDEARY